MSLERNFNSRRVGLKQNLRKQQQICLARHKARIAVLQGLGFEQLLNIENEAGYQTESAAPLDCIYVENARE